jgi:hypothetical protein
VSRRSGTAVVRYVLNDASSLRDGDEQRNDWYEMEGREVRESVKPSLGMKT